MRHKRLKLSAVLLLVLGLTGLQAQTMYVKQSSGTQTSYTLSSIQKMTFPSGSVTVQKTDNSTGVYDLSGLRYLNFIDISTSIADQPMQLGNAKFITYPNPVTDVLNVDITDISSEVTISILSLEGKVLQTHKNKGTNTVILNLSQLPQGIYLCRYSNALEIKTVKIIKQ